MEAITIVDRFEVAGTAGINRVAARAWIVICAALVTGCVTERPPVGSNATLSREQARMLIDESVPHRTADRSGWVDDIYAGFSLQQLQLTRENICAVVAVIEQESNFQVDPVVPGLGRVAWREIDSRAQRAGVPRLIVHAALDLRSPNGRTYSDRINAARTEKNLSDIYEDFIGAVPLGRRLFADWNPIRTRGPMQVNVAFAKQYADVRPYPYPIKDSIADEVFTRRGSLYFGIAHLLAYQPPYDAYLFRFADFNAGQYASRNAAFQSALSEASGIALVTDGALVSHESGASGSGDTERALRALADRLNVSERDIHDALEQGKTRDLERTAVYQRVFTLAERVAKHPLPRALVPMIKLEGPKISHSLTTSWYAHRVEGRFERCLAR